MKTVLLFVMALEFPLICSLSSSERDSTYRRKCSVSQRNLLENARFRWEDGHVVFQTFRETILPPDTLRILALRVEFQEDENEQTTGDGRFDLSTPAGPILDSPPHDRTYFEEQLIALGNYYGTVSNSRLILLTEVTPEVYTLPREMERYNPGMTEDALHRGLVELFRDAVERADSAGVVFSDYDCFIVFHAGVGLGIDLGYDPTPNDIPSAFINLEDFRKYLGNGDPLYEGIGVEGGNYHVTEGIILPETESQEGYEIGLLGTMAQIFGYQIGLPSLWNTRTGRSGIGGWGLMDQGGGNYYGMIPAQPCGWSKVFLGWEDPIEIHRGVDLTIACSQASYANKIYKIPINDREYFLIENRMHDTDGDSVTVGWTNSGMQVIFQPDGNIVPKPSEVIIGVEEYDYGLPGSGILIWHVDESIIEENLVTNTINADADHRGVDLEEADGAQDIGESYGMLEGGAGSEIGVLHDAWFGNNEINKLVNGSDEVAFTPVTHPNSRSNSGANSHIVISDFSGIDTVMWFSVGNDLLQKGFPQDFGVGGIPYPPLFGDLDGDGSTEIVVATEDGRIFAWKKDGERVVPNDVTGYRLTVSGDTVVFPVPLFADTEEEIVATPVMDDVDGNGLDEIIAATGGGGLIGWKYFDSRAEMFLDWNGMGESITALVFIHGNFVVGTETGKVLAVTAGGETLWQQDLQGGRIVGLCQYRRDNIIVTTQNQMVVALRSTGEVLWTRSMDSWEGLGSPVSSWFPSVTSPSILIVLCRGMGFILDAVGGEKARFGVGMLPEILSDPVLGDLDNDGFMEITLTAGGQVWCFNHNGSLLDNFPSPYLRRNDFLSSPVLGDVDGDGNTDIVFTSSKGNLEAYRSDGMVIDGFPLTTGGLVAISPTLMDLDDDGDIEVAAVSERGLLYVWDWLGEYRPELVPWGSYHHDPAHSGMSQQVLVKQPPGSEFMPENLVYNYPNPTEGDFTTIRYRLEYAAQIWVKIFDLAGELVDEFAGPGEPLTENEVVWNLKDVESGVYFCQVRAEGSLGEKVVTFKIAVVK